MNEEKPSYSLPAIAIRNPVFAWMLMFGLIVFGAIAVQRLPVGQYPDVDFPIVSISATLEGAAPEIMETDVADVIEDAVMAVEGIRDITTNCRQGSASITIEFDINRSIDLAVQDVQSRLAQAMRKLPTEIDPLEVKKSNPEENPFMWVAVSGTRSQQEISEYAKNVLRDRFLTVDGNGDVMMGGYLERNVRIWIDPQQLNARGLSADDLLRAAQRQHVDVPAGRMEGASREANIQVEGEALSLEQMRKILLSNEGGSPVYLTDVALVEDGFEDKRRTARVNGLTAQGMGIIKQTGANTVAVADGVRSRVKELQPTLPAGLEMDIRVDNSKFIREAIGEMSGTLVHAVLLTALVCWLFLGSLSSTLNVVLAIPVSIFGTFAVMHFLGFSLNTFTLLALSLSVGIVVDDAIMVLENIYRHAEMGKDKVTAARDGAEQISFAALAATIAIIAIFLPVAFMQGIIGQFFFQFGVVLSVAVAISLVEALTLAPARCAQFMQVGNRSNIIERGAHAAFGALAWLYKTILRAILTVRLGIPSLLLVIALLIATAVGAWLVHVPVLGVFRSAGQYLSAGDYIPAVGWGSLGVLAIAALVLWIVWLVHYIPRFRAFPVLSVAVLLLSFGGFAWSMKLVNELPKEMVPAQDQGFLRLRVTGPVGSTLEYNDEVMKGIEKRLQAKYSDVIESNFVVAGSMGGDVNSGLAFITFVERDKRSMSQQEIIRELRKDFEENAPPGCRVVIQDPSTEGFSVQRRGSYNVEFAIQGPNWDKLGELSETYMQEMRSRQLFAAVDTDFRKGMPEIQVIPDREKALANGIDMKTLADTVGMLVGGQKVARYKHDGRRYDIRARLLRDDRSRPEDIGELYLRNKDGKLVRIADVASITVRPALQSITRRNRERAVTMYANANTGYSQEQAIKAVEEITQQILPEGYRIVFTGNAKTFRESFDSLVFALGLGLIVAYMVLASQFNSFIHPLTILMALPFSVSGALIALMLTGQSMNVYSMIGLILLMGIVKKNSILLVEYTNQMREQGMDRVTALVEACPVRLRPILMTSIATIAGAIPGALNWGAGGELRIPMSVAVIGGLAISTVLTLFVVPCFYQIVDELQDLLLRRKPQEKTSVAVPAHAGE